jgi:hypothetical protein
MPGGPLLKSGAKRFLEGVCWNLYFDMFGNLFKRLAPGRAEGGSSKMRLPCPVSKELLTKNDYSD